MIPLISVSENIMTVIIGEEKATFKLSDLGLEKSGTQKVSKQEISNFEKACGINNVVNINDSNITKEVKCPEFSLQNIKQAFNIKEFSEHKYNAEAILSDKNDQLVVNGQQFLLGGQSIVINSTDSSEWQSNRKKVDIEIDRRKDQNCAKGNVIVKTKVKTLKDGTYKVDQKITNNGQSHFKELQKVNNKRIKAQQIKLKSKKK